MKCGYCGNENAYRMRFSADGESCDQCGAAGSSAVYDVYWDGKPEQGLADDPVTGKPRIFSSKGEKAAYLRSRGLQEAGDTYHGAPLQIHKNQERRSDSRHEVMMALKKVREMGQDVRRQEYLKIVKGRRP